MSRDCNTRRWRKGSRNSARFRQYLGTTDRTVSELALARGSQAHERRLAARSYRLPSSKSLTTMSGALAFVTRCRDGRLDTTVDAPRFKGGATARKSTPMAGRPKSRKKRALKEFLQRKYDNAGDYIRFKAVRSRVYGPVRPEAQPRWLGVEPKRGYRTASNPRVPASIKSQMPAIRRQLEKAGIDASTIKHHLWRMSFYQDNDGEATSEIDLPGGGIGYIVTRKRGGKLVTKIKKD